MRSTSAIANFYVNGWLDPGNPGGQFMQPRSYGANEAGNIPGGVNYPYQAVVNTLFARYGVNSGRRRQHFRVPLQRGRLRLRHAERLRLQRPVELS